MTAKTPEQLLKETRSWWSTSIIDVQPGEILVRGYRLDELVGRVDFAQMVWLMVRGEIPDTAQARLLNAALVASVDHGPHAPSIAISRMAVTCGLPINGAMASAVNSLDDIHGGAGEQCMAMMQRIAQRSSETTDAALAVAVEVELDAFIADNGKIVPGFGHRFHGVDPRATRLIELLSQACARREVAGLYLRIGALIEESLYRRKGVRAPMNVDGATAAIYMELGFACALGRGLFILARSVGILAHAWEQTQQGGRTKGPMPPSVSYRYTGDRLRPVPEQPADTLER
jgi:citrate synthase